MDFVGLHVTLKTTVMLTRDEAKTPIPMSEEMRNHTANALLPIKLN